VVPLACERRQLRGLAKDATSDYGTGWAALGALGYRFDNRMRLKAEVGHRLNDGVAHDTIAGTMEHELSALCTLAFPQHLRSS